MANFDTYTLDSGLVLKYWTRERLWNEWEVGSKDLSVIANACRLNVLSSIKAEIGRAHV